MKVADPKERIKDLELISELLDELAVADLPAEMDPERHRLMSLGESTREQPLIVPPGEGEQSYTSTTGCQHIMFPSAP